MTRSTHYAMNTDGVYTCLACDSPESMYHKNTCVYYRNPIEESRNKRGVPYFEYGQWIYPKAKATGGVVGVKPSDDQVPTQIERGYIIAHDIQRATLSDPVDMVSHPAHYNNGPPCPGCGRTIECIDVIEYRPCLRANAIKYLWRADDKGKTIEDLKKAIWYIQREIDNLEKEPAG